MPPKRHARLGASKAERWINCPGSIRLSEGLPNYSSEYAREGTAAHEVAEMCLKNGKDAIEFLGAEIKVEGHLVEVTEEMCEAVQVFVSHVRKVAGKRQLMVEQKFDLSPLNPPDEMYGTSDAVVWDEKTKILDVTDYKHGKGVAVDVIENEQLSIYGIGSVLKLGKKPKKIRLHVIQPRAHHPDGPIRIVEYTYAQLVAFKKLLFAAAAETLKPDAKLQVGAWCRFCPAMPKCPAQHKHAIETAQEDFAVVKYEPSLPSPEVLSDEQITLILERSGDVIAWLRSIEASIHQRLANGGEFEGFKLVDKRANRKWKDPDQASSELERHLGEKAYVRKPLSPAQAEKELKVVGKTLNADLFVKESSGTNLVKASDPRPASTRAAADEFTCDTED